MLLAASNQVLTNRGLENLDIKEVWRQGIQEVSSSLWNPGSPSQSSSWARCGIIISLVGGGCVSPTLTLSSEYDQRQEQRGPRGVCLLLVD